MDYTAITSAVDFSAAVTAVGAIAASIAVVYIAITGWRALKSMLKSG